MYDIPPKLDTEVVLLHPGSVINSKFDDLAPVLVEGPGGKKTLVFTSNKPLKGTEDQVEKLYLSEASGEDWSTAERWFAAVDPSIREGALAANGNDWVFVQCYRDDGIGDCDLCALKGGVENLESKAGQSVGTVLPMPLNSKDWDHHPALSPTGDTLVFASERYGGVGQSDIWLTTRNGKGEWMPPRLFPDINTRGNEISPSFSPDGNTLYFATDERPGYGEFDLWYVSRSDGKWSAPKHLIAPVNSAGNDIFYHVVNSDRAFLASDRKGSYGGFDIYEVSRPTTPRVVTREPLVLRITARNAYTRDPIPAEITLSEEDGLDLKTSEGVLEQQILPKISYAATAYMRGYMNAVGTYTFADSAQGLRAHDLYLTPSAEKERTIYAFLVEFDFSLFNIRPEEEKHLDSVVTLLAAYPNSTVVVSGHTDSVGTVSYNIKLGYNRATRVSEYVKTYLRQHGTTLQNDMEIRTYGKSEPVASNSTDEGRQRNRRVEIAIIRNE